jgi:multidrug efflux pump subunit AcrB
MPYSALNGTTAIFADLNTQSGSNPLEINKLAGQYINHLKQKIGNEYSVTELFNMAVIMKAAMDEVIFTIVIACLLVIAVALIFLGRFKVTLIPIAIIPVCLLGTVIVLQILGMSLNTITLLAMVIAVGLVVDDAIVVVENITALIEKGVPKYRAIIEGTSSIAITIIGITLTLVAVYMPLVFISATIIQVIKPFALTLVIAVLISGLAALTLTPLMAVILVSDKKPNRYQILFEYTLAKAINIYHAILNIMLKFPKLMILILIILLSISIHFAIQLPKQVYPSDPNGMAKVLIEGSPSDTIDSLKKKLNQFSLFYQQKQIENYGVQIMQDDETGRFTAVLLLVFKKYYLKDIYGFVDKMSQFINKHHLQNTYTMANSYASWSGDYDLSFYLYGGSSAQLLNQAAERMTKALQQSHIFSMVNNTISNYKKQLVFDINSVKAERVGISRKSIMQLLSTYYGGYTLDNNFSINGLSVPIVVKLENKNLKNFNSLEKITIISPETGKSYPISAFVKFRLVAKPTIAATFNNQLAVKVNANLAKAHDMDEAIAKIQSLMSQYGGSLQYQYVGNAKDYLDGNSKTIMIVIMGIVCIYVLLSFVFGSLIDPFIILLTVPFSVVGGALSLYLIGGSINIFSTLGLITLIGLITKHGVLIVQFANNELKKGVELKEAILLATHHRFRPIMMTTLAMIFGALPLLISNEVMYVSRANLAIVIMGGLVIGTLFSLFVVPLVYEVVKNIELKLTSFFKNELEQV